MAARESSRAGCVAQTARRDAGVTMQPKRTLVHSAHAAAWRSTMSASCCGLLVVFPDVGHQSFGGEHQAGDRCGVLEGEARDLGWVDYARLDHVAELASIPVEAEAFVLAVTTTI